MMSYKQDVGTVLWGPAMILTELRRGHGNWSEGPEGKMAEVLTKGGAVKVQGVEWRQAPSVEGQLFISPKHP